jgi:hypothetical protein
VFGLGREVQLSEICGLESWEQYLEEGEGDVRLMGGRTVGKWVCRIGVNRNNTRPCVLERISY